MKKAILVVCFLVLYLTRWSDARPQFPRDMMVLARDGEMGVSLPNDLIEDEREAGRDLDMAPPHELPHEKRESYPSGCRHSWDCKP